MCVWFVFCRCRVLQPYNLGRRHGCEMKDALANTQMNVRPDVHVKEGKNILRSKESRNDRLLTNVCMWQHGYVRKMQNGTVCDVYVCAMWVAIWLATAKLRSLMSSKRILFHRHVVLFELGWKSIGTGQDELSWGIEKARFAIKKETFVRFFISSWMISILAICQPICNVLLRRLSWPRSDCIPSTAIGTIDRPSLSNIHSTHMHELRCPQWPSPLIYL